MNAFYEHHENSIRFGYRCFDRILLNGLIQPFQQPKRVVGFFNTYRQLYPVSQAILRDIATQYQHWVTARAHAWGAPILDAPTGRRDDFVDPYFVDVGAVLLEGNARHVAFVSEASNHLREAAGRTASTAARRSVLRRGVGKRSLPRFSHLA